MSLGGFLVLTICIWWLLYYMALPIGRKRDFDPDENGAPDRPRLLIKGIIVTAITAVIMIILTLMNFGVFLSCYVNGDPNCGQILRFGG